MKKNERIQTLEEIKAEILPIRWSPNPAGINPPGTLEPTWAGAMSRILNIIDEKMAAEKDPKPEKPPVLDFHAGMHKK